jgi:queuine tRNA-ribosyltransferase
MNRGARPTFKGHLPDRIWRGLAVGEPRMVMLDMFDCVLPTRAGRHGLAYTRAGRLNLRDARHADDPSPIDPLSSCGSARDYSRAYLHHLLKSGEILGMMLLTEINLAYYQDLMEDIRRAIAAGRFDEFRDAAKTAWRSGEATAQFDQGFDLVPHKIAKP